MKQSEDPPRGDTVIELLIQVLLKIIQKLSEPIPLFLIAIGILVLLAAAIGGENLVVEVRIFLAFLGAIGIIGVIASQLLSNPSKSHLRGGIDMTNESSGQEQYRFLRNFLNSLTDTQLQEMINFLLEPKQQDDLEKPISKGRFLKDMQRWGKLDQVQSYLEKTFPEYFREE
jgi:hypothetical protein